MRTGWGFVAALLAACGSDSTGVDGGIDGASNDAPARTDAPSTDAGTDGGKDGGADTAAMDAPIDSPDSGGIGGNTDLAIEVDQWDYYGMGAAPLPGAAVRVESSQGFIDDVTDNMGVAHIKVDAQKGPFDITAAMKNVEWPFLGLRSEGH